MPVRNFPIATGEIYHVFNRGIDYRTTFNNRREFSHAVKVLDYYRFVLPPFKLSKLSTLALIDQEKIMSELHEKGDKLIEILAYCLMPNHFHLLLKQVVDRGISKFISQFENSYTRYFNTIYERVGPLFLDQFKTVRVQTEEQLLHVSRYIHLNPYTSYVVKDFDSLFSYPWSSLEKYFIKEKSSLCNKDIVLSLFKKPYEYRNFILDQASYQRELDKIKHLTIEN